MLVKKIMKVLSNLFGLNKKISASDIAVKDSNNKAITLDNFFKKKGICELWSGNLTDTSESITLSKTIDNFDLICIVTRNDAGAQSLFRLNNVVIPVLLYKDGGTNYNIPAGASNSIILNITSNNTIKVQSGISQYYSLMKVYGIKL